MFKSTGVTVFSKDPAEQLCDYRMRILESAAAPCRQDETLCTKRMSMSRAQDPRY